MLNKLIVILKEETELYRELLSLLQEERELLSKRKRDELYTLSHKIGALVFRVNETEKVREQILDGIAGTFGLTKDNGQSYGWMNLSQVIEMVEEPYKGSLKQIQSKLQALIEGIKELTQENSIVIGRSIENIKTAFLFLKELSTNETYCPSGRIG